MAIADRIAECSFDITSCGNDFPAVNAYEYPSCVARQSAGDNKNMKTKQDVIETMKSSIDAQINDDKNHGWGQTDSMAVIGDLLAEFGGDFAIVENKEIRESVLAGINQVVNPSACRQWLESDKVGKLNKQESGRSKSSKLFAQF